MELFSRWRKKAEFMTNRNYRSSNNPLIMSKRNGVLFGDDYDIVGLKM